MGHRRENSGEADWADEVMITLKSGSTTIATITAKLYKTNP